MKLIIALLIAGVTVATSASAQLPGLGDLLKSAGSLPKSSAPGSAVDDKTAGAGIKEALAKGTEEAVNKLSTPNGYFSNQAVKILMPPSIQKIADVARTVGFQKQVDDFILSMNRAAEAAAPLAARFFADAIREMTFDDVRGLLTGGDTAATEFFKRKTHDKLYAAFKPVVSEKVQSAGATQAYNNLKDRASSVPFIGGGQSLDLDDYVTNKSLDGLFLMVAEQEKNIRNNPLARGSDLLKAVFGK